MTPDEWCYFCERFHGPMDYGDLCWTESDDARAAHRRANPLPWATSFAWLRGRQCRARLRRAEGYAMGRWGRCELALGHVAYDDTDSVDHALEFGMDIVRWPAWTSGAPYIESGVLR